MSAFVRSLDEDDLDAMERAAVEMMTTLFVVIESSAGRCFDVLVREAIERGEKEIWAVKAP